MLNISFTHNITYPIKFTIFIKKLTAKIQSISKRPGRFEILLQPGRKFFRAKISFIFDYLFLFYFEYRQSLRGSYYLGFRFFAFLSIFYL